MEKWNATDEKGEQNLQNVFDLQVEQRMFLNTADYNGRLQKHYHQMLQNGS